MAGRFFLLASDRIMPRGTSIVAAVTVSRPQWTSTKLQRPPRLSFVVRGAQQAPPPQTSLTGRTIVHFSRTKTLSLRISHASLSAMVVVFLAGLLVPQSMVAQTESVLYNFCSLTNCTDGHGPAGTLVRDANGNFYGATEGGGVADGTVFKVSPDGGETVIYNFEFANNDGSFPEDGVIIDAQRNLYGTTLYGGSANLGTVYKISPAGSETILHSFTGGSTMESAPMAPCSGTRTATSTARPSRAAHTFMALSTS